ncbi:MAG: DNA alkylation repair protein [Isosphaeraceae bacterium]
MLDGHPLTASEIRERLRAMGSPEAAATAAGFFKTGPGQYGEGDRFLGVRVPALRTLARECRTLPLDQATELLRSEFHEERLLALLILVAQAEKGGPAAKERIYRLYLDQTRLINNWDLVDTSAPAIVGGYLADRSRKPLDRLARSRSLWERRIAIIATLHFIRRGEFADTLRIAETLLDDREDLIHKAVGWMLREAGKRDQAVLEGFLDQHASRMPRTMLRYAIERFPAEVRKAYLSRPRAGGGLRPGEDHQRLA